MKITIDLDNLLEDLPKASEVLRALQPLMEAGTAQHSRVTIPALASRGNVAEWFGHLGPGSRKFWEIAATHCSTHSTFTFEDISTPELSKETLRSYHRNSYRAIKAAGATDPLEKTWDAQAGQYVYRMSHSVRGEILSLI